MKDWEHKDIWKRGTQHFTVQVERREVGTTEDRREGPHRWNIYAYIYPTHPHFHKFDGAGLWQEACNEMPLHAGASYLKYHQDALNGEITSVQVGCDYNHDGDERFTWHADPGAAIRQFRDADMLFNWLAQGIAAASSTEGRDTAESPVAS